MDSTFGFPYTFLRLRDTAWDDKIAGAQLYMSKDIGLQSVHAFDTKRAPVELTLGNATVFKQLNENKSADSVLEVEVMAVAHVPLGKDFEQSHKINFPRPAEHYFVPKETLQALKTESALRDYETILGAIFAKVIKDR